MLTLHKLLTVYGINPEDTRILRHTDVEIPVFETFSADIDKLTEYTSWQPEGKYGSAKYLVVFCATRSTTALFLGIWKIDGVTFNKGLTEDHHRLLTKYNLPEKWFRESVRYDLSLTSYMEDLSCRLVIDWGKSCTSWMQSIDKNIIQIKPVNSIGEFKSYDDVQLAYPELKQLVSNQGSNYVWCKALSSIKGIYVIKDTLSGELYVGSASGKEGILGRWADYANNGHSGNQLLYGKDYNYFEYSILEITPSTMSKSEIDKRETRWKDRLGSKENGLNKN